MEIGMSGKAVDERAQVLSIEAGNGRSIRALLSAPQIASMARPMQFVMVRLGNGSDPFLRRPFGLSLINASSGIIGVTWEVVGRGTEMMSNWEPGQEFSVLGPLGNGIGVLSPTADACSEGSKRVTGRYAYADINDDPKDASSKNWNRVSPRGPYLARRGHLFLIAGGTGLAPLLPLAAEARSKGWQVSLFYGARSSESLLDCSGAEALGCDVRLATDDGTAGSRGFVTDLASLSLEGAQKSDLAVACGPAPMLRVVKSLCSRLGVELWVSLEERMACGTGLCKGCAVKKADSEGYYHVCTDGPVFRARDVDLGGETR